MNISAFGVTHIGGIRNTENQDTFFVGDGHYGVFDGHGSQGLAAARAARDTLSAPGATFAEADAAVCAALPVVQDGRCNGTTASVLRIDKSTGTLEVQHVGDSDVRYFDCQGEGDEGSEGVSLSADHSALSKEEFLRIHALPAPAAFLYAVSSRSGGAPSPVFIPDEVGGWVQNPTGNYYSTVRNEWAAYLQIPCKTQLAMTRALGDVVMKPYGVIATPSVLTAPPLTEGRTRAIVMASDGVWDTSQYAEIGAIVSRPDLIGNAEAAAAAILAEVLAKQTTLLGAYGDNATVIVAYVSPPKSSVDDL
jgi:serine/threonine protein phosphatase PrpC